MTSTRASRPAPRRRDPDAFTPIFVLAPARSCSSVVTTMIGRHPALYGFPELSLFRGEVVGDLLRPTPRRRPPAAPARISGLLRTLAQLHEGRQDADTIVRSRQWLDERRDWSVAHLLDHLLAEVSPAHGIENSPEDSNREDYLERLDGCYPRARYLHLTRHPVTTAESMNAAWAGSGLWEVPPDLFPLMCLATWLFHHARIKRFLEGLPAERWLRIRAEDVLNDPQHALPRICHWLDIDADAAALAAMSHPESSPYACLGPPGARGGNDPRFLDNPRPRPTVLPDQLRLPVGWTIDPWLYVAVAQFAQTIGYPASPGGSAERRPEHPADHG